MGAFVSIFVHFQVCVHNATGVCFRPGCPDISFKCRQMSSEHISRTESGRGRVEEGEREREREREREDEWRRERGRWRESWSGRS